MQILPFHPAVAAWLQASFEAPTPVQSRAWAALREPGDLLVAAPTGAGKTLAAFLSVIDELVREGVQGRLARGVHVLYVSPLKALGNDIQRNLEAPLAGIAAELAARGMPGVEIVTAVRTGDTPQAGRTLMRRRPPHVLVTTPESLYILLSSDSGRDMLKTVRTIIVDEIHAVAGTKRGAHLALSLERLAALTPVAPRRIGLSATQKPLDEIGCFLSGVAVRDLFARAPRIIDEGHARARDVAIELPSTPLDAVLSGDAANEIYDRIAALVASHRTTLVFVNTRRMSERVAKALGDRLGPARISSHHGSMARELRLAAERRLKEGELQALVATASLELGIDIGEIDLVCQLGATRTVANFLQRVGRAGHRLGAVAKGRLFPQSLDELVECAALLDMTRRGELDRIEIAGPSLDVLAQQIVAEVACRDIECDALFDLVRGAYPYRALTRERFDAVLAMLSEGYSFARGRRGAYVTWDRVNGRLRPRPGARLVAITCGGAIPDTADYDVLLEPAGQFVGTVNEDFAIESLPGSIFQLGNNAWRVLRVDQNAVRVADAQGEPPNMPFWLGEAPARSRELSEAVSRLREEFAARWHATPAAGRRAALQDWLCGDLALDAASASQLLDYFSAGLVALGAMPTQRTLVLERFFDESGGMQLVVHSPFGSRLNRAWGLALRKRFCRQFNFELQAAAVEDAIVISLGAVHSFPLEDVWRFLRSGSVRDVLVQALLDAPMFTVRWRWVASCALAILRSRGGTRTPPRLMRMQAEDLAALVFPDQLACAENLHGRREVPDHPLVWQAIQDCLQEVMDCAGLEALLVAIEQAELTLVCRDLTAPSPFAQAVLNANPYAFLDDAPLEERRTQAVQSRRRLDPETARDLAALDPAAIARVIDEVWPQPRSRDELHDALCLLGVVSPERLVGAAADAARLADWMQDLADEGRVLGVTDAGLAGCRWVATERAADLCALWPRTGFSRPLPAWLAAEVDPDRAADAVLRGWLDVCGPVTVDDLVHATGLPATTIGASLARLEAGGSVFRGRFRPGVDEVEWCERRLLARIHRYTLNRLRAEIEPVSAVVFLRFLFEWQYVAHDARVEGPQAALKVLELLSGFEAPAGAWEQALLPRRIRDYSPDVLERLTARGQVAWCRMATGEARGIGAALTRVTPVTFLCRGDIAAWRDGLVGSAPANDGDGPAARVARFLSGHGASFFEDIVEGTGLLRTQVETALAELVAAGHASSDSVHGLRVLLTPSGKRAPLGRARSRRGAAIEDSGRWTLLPCAKPAQSAPGEQVLEIVARGLLRRYGVVFRRLLEREPLPHAWRDILRALRRLEARGEIRGGRFVSGFTGEQFALPEAIPVLRRIRQQPGSGNPEIVAATDPLNLVGILTPDARVPAVAANHLAFIDGDPVAVRNGTEVTLLRTLPAAIEIRVRTALLESGRTAAPRGGARRVGMPGK